MRELEASLQRFADFLLQAQLVTEKAAPYRVRWIRRFLGQPEEALHLPKSSEYAMRHFSLYDLNKFVPAHLRYANTEAEQKFKDGKKLTPVYLFGSMGNYFYLFYKGGFRAGMRGLLVALLYVFFRLMVSVRLYELEHGLDLESIEAEYAKAKRRIVADIEANR